MNIVQIGGSWVNLDAVFMANLIDNPGNKDKPFIFSGSLSGGKTFCIDATVKQARTIMHIMHLNTVTVRCKDCKHFKEWSYTHVCEVPGFAAAEAKENDEACEHFIKKE